MRVCLRREAEELAHKGKLVRFDEQDHQSRNEREAAERPLRRGTVDVD
jgi:hypothetical protein